MVIIHFCIFFCFRAPRHIIHHLSISVAICDVLKLLILSVSSKQAISEIFQGQ